MDQMLSLNNFEKAELFARVELCVEKGEKSDDPLVKRIVAALDRNASTVPPDLEECLRHINHRK